MRSHRRRHSMTEPPAGRSTWAIVVTPLMAFGTLMLHLLTTTGYGLSGDELYAIACSNHPAAGYVDLGPLPVLLLTLQRHLGGDSLLAVRAVAALTSACTVYCTGAIARSMGAGTFGQFLASLCALVVPAFLFGKTGAVHEGSG